MGPASDGTVDHAAPDNGKPLADHHAGRCPDCGGRLVCVACNAPTAKSTDVDALVKLATVVDVGRERDRLAKRAPVAEARARSAEGERDAPNAELRRRPPEGAVRSFAISKAADLLAHERHTEGRRGSRSSRNPRLYCSPGMTRTCDPVINSHLLCQLSYWGMAGARI